MNKLTKNLLLSLSSLTVMSGIYLNDVTEEKEINLGTLEEITVEEEGIKEKSITVEEQQKELNNFKDVTEKVHTEPVTSELYIETNGKYINSTKLEWLFGEEILSHFEEFDVEKDKLVKELNERENFKFEMYSFTIDSFEPTEVGDKYNLIVSAIVSNDDRQLIIESDIGKLVVEMNEESNKIEQSSFNKM